MYSFGMFGRHFEKTFLSPISSLPLSMAPSLVMYRAVSSPLRSRSAWRVCLEQGGLGRAATVSVVVWWLGGRE